MKKKTQKLELIKSFGALVLLAIIVTLASHTPPATDKTLHQSAAANQTTQDLQQYSLLFSNNLAPTASVAFGDFREWFKNPLGNQLKKIANDNTSSYDTSKIKLKGIISNSTYLHLEKDTLYYNNNAEKPSQFKLIVEAFDPNAGIAEIAGSRAFGDNPVSHIYPYTLDYSIEKDSICPESKITIFATTGAKVTNTKEIDCILDGDGPINGSVDYPDGFRNNPIININVNPGKDSISGMSQNAEDYLLEYKVAPLENGSCGEFGEWKDTGINEITETGNYSFQGQNANCYQFRYSVKDMVGNKSIYTNGSIIKVDTTTTVLDNISINQGAETTNDPTVTLTLSAKDAFMGRTMIQLSCNHQIWTELEPFVTEKQFDLTSFPGAGCNDDEGKKTVYARFSNKDGKWGDVVSDNIFYSKNNTRIEVEQPEPKNSQIWEEGGMADRFTPEMELPELRDAYAKHFKLPNGSLVAAISSVPIHYQEDGQWKEVIFDYEPNTSGQHTEYEYATLHNTIHYFTPAKSGNQGKMTDFGKGGIYKSWIRPTMEWVNTNGNKILTTDAAEVEGVVDANRIIYSEVFENTDVIFTQGIFGITSDIILNNKDALNDMPSDADTLAYCENVVLPDNWTYETKTDPAYPDKIMEVIFKDGQGQEALIYPQPGIYEKENMDQMIFGHYGVRKNNQYLTICKQVPVEWLTAPERKFPIVVDPTEYLGAAYQTGANYWSGTIGLTSDTKWDSDVDVGCWVSGSDTCPANVEWRRGFAFFPINSIMDGSNIITAYVRMHSYTLTSSQTIYATPLSSTSPTSTGTSIETDCGDDGMFDYFTISAANYYHYFCLAGTCPTSSGDNSNGGAYNNTGETTLENALATRTYWGACFRRNLESSGTGYNLVRFDQWNDATTYYRPMMYIEYDTPTISVTVTTPYGNSTYYVNNGTTMTFDGPSIGSGTCYGYWDTNTTYLGTETPSVSLGTDCDGTLSAPSCTNNTTYYGCIRAVDANGAVANYACDSVVCDSLAPSAPTITCTSDGYSYTSNVWASYGSPNCQWTINSSGTGPSPITSWFSIDGSCSSYSQSFFGPQADTGFGEGANWFCARNDDLGGTGTAASFLVKRDQTAPSSAVTNIVNSYYGPNTYSTTTTIAGTAADATSGISYVNVYVYRASDSYYWNGSSWATEPTYNTATGTTSWYYPGIASSNFSNGETYGAYARAYDNTNDNYTTGRVDTFIWDSAVPSTTYSLANTYYGPYTWSDVISGTASDSGSGVWRTLVSVYDSTISRWYNGTAPFDSTTQQWFNATGTTSWSFNFPDTAYLTDGHSYTIYAYSQDNVINDSTTVNDSFTYDRSTPTQPTMTAEPAYTPGTSNTVYTSGSTDIGVGGVQYEFCSNTSDTTTGCNSSGWTSNTYYTFSSLSNGQIYYYFVRAKDSLDNTTAWSSSTSSTQDATTPSVATPTIYSGTQYDNIWFKGTISLRSAISDSGSGIASGTCQVSINSGEWTSTGVTQDANYCYYNSYTPNANFNIQFRVQDTAGNWGSHLRQYYYYDETAPYLSSQTGFNTDWYTSTQTSNFYYTDDGVGIASGSPASCVISTNGTSSTCSVTPNVCDHLSNCNTTQVTSNAIKLDTVHPTLTFNGVSESSDYIYYSGSAIYYNNSVPSGQSFTLDYNLTDNLSGALQGAYYIAGELAFGTAPTAGTPFDLDYTIDNAETCDGVLTTVGYDYAMNDSNPDGVACTLDTTAPTTTNAILINSGATYTTSATVTLTLSSTDSGAGLNQMQFSCDNSNWTTPESYNTTKSFNITNQPGAGCSTSQGSKTVYVKFKDNVNNWSTATSDSITYDSIGPTVTIDQAGGQADPTNTSPINFTVVFSESVTGFATGDVTLSGTAGATTATVTGSDTTYNVAVSGMTGDGTVIPTIGAGVATDAAGNGNTASTSTDNTVTYDITGPTINSITSVAGDTTAPYYDITDDSSTSIIFVSSDSTSAVDSCKWDTDDVAYASMTHTCTSPTNCVTDLSGDGVKTVYIRCMDLAGNAMTSSEAVTYTIYSTPPTITDANISIAGGTGTDGAYKVGDTITVIWDNSTATGDGNTDLTGDPTANLSGWGGSSTAAMTDTDACGGTPSDDIWEACYTLVTGTIDNTNVNASVTATNLAGSTTRNDTTNATVDNQPPIITSSGTLTITTDNGIEGIAALNNGTSNQDKVTQSSATVAIPDNDTTTINLTLLTGQATVNAGTESGVVIPGTLDNSAQTFTITVTDDAGNTDTANSAEISVDNIPPTVTTSAISVLGATGENGKFITGDTATGRWDNSDDINDADNSDYNSDTITSVSFNLSDWIATADSISGTDNSGIWTTSEQSPLDSQSTTGNNAIVTATDNAGNITTTEGTNNYTIETLATDPNTSSFTATPTTVMADGISTTLLTATLRDASSDPVAGATVNVSATGATVRPINCTTTDVGVITKGRSNSNGQACFLATSSTMTDNLEFTATDTSNSIEITQKAYVSYTNCLIDRSSSTFTASKAQVQTDGLDSADLNLHLTDYCGFDVDKTDVVTLDDNSATFVTYTPPGSTAPQTYSTSGGGLLTTAISSLTSGLFTFDAGLNEKQYDTTVYTENPGLPNEYNGSGSLIIGSANQDDTQVSFNMPFDFSLYSQTVTAGNPVYLCTNGFISLSSTTCPASGALTDAIAGYHMDLTTNNGGIYQRTTSNSITFVFDAQTKSAEDVNFEIKLYDSNRIEIHYEDAATAASPFIGLYNHSSVADASSLLAPRTNKATMFEYDTPVTPFDLDNHPQVEFLAGDVNITNSTVEADPSAVTADGNSYSIVTVTVRDDNMNPIPGRDIQLDQDGSAQITQVNCGDLTTPAPNEPTDTNGKACYQATDEIAQLVTFTATDITDLPLILGSDTVDFGCVTGPGQQCLQVTLEEGEGSITMTPPSDFSFLPVSSSLFAQEQFTCDDAILCPDNLTGYNLNVDDLLTVTDTRNLGGFTVQLQASTPFEKADNVFLPFQNFYVATTPATTGGTKIGGIEYDLNYSGITCTGAPLNTTGSLLSADSFTYNFGTGNTIPSTIHDLMQCEVNHGQGRNATMKQNVNYHLLLPALQPPGLYQVTLTYDLVI